MRVLHLFSNHKLTGPAEPALILAAHLRRAGADVLVGVGRAPGSSRRASGPGNPSLAEMARGMGLQTLDGLFLRKHHHVFLNAIDRRRLRREAAAADLDVIHCHLRNDHWIASSLAGPPPGDVRLVRSFYGGPPIHLGFREGRLMRHRADAVFVFGERVREGLVASGVPAERIHVIEGAVDLARFDPGRPLEDPSNAIGIGRDDFVVGIVARMQRHRQFPLALSGIARAMATEASIRLVIVGRGTRWREVALRPSEALGIGDRVRFTGYLSGDRYLEVLKRFQVKLFLVPGSDGTCRAVREAMAMGVPVIASGRGLLPEIVADGETGLIVPETPEGIAQGILRLVREPSLRDRLGASARAAACGRFSPERQAAAVLDLYRRLVSRSGSSGQGEASSAGR